MGERPDPDNGSEHDKGLNRIDRSLREVEALLRQGEPVPERPKPDPDVLADERPDDYELSEEERERLIAEHEQAARRVLDESVPPLPDATDKEV